MKKNDLFFALFFILLFLPFVLLPQLLDWYKNFNNLHPYAAGFAKFAILATMGESLGLRLREGVYSKVGFGLLPRAIVWGFLGITIVMAFQIFTGGAFTFLKNAGMTDAAEAFVGPMSAKRFLIAFTISATLNLIYAPVMMTLHKITDTHIVANGGTVAGMLRPIEMEKIFVGLDWRVQWSFIFKKTIPFFWIPMHTITFLLPGEYRILFAALLGIALGVILSIGVLKSKK